MIKNKIKFVIKKWKYSKAKNRQGEILLNYCTSQLKHSKPNLNFLVQRVKNI